MPRKSRARLNKTSPQGIAQEAARAAKKAELEMRRLAHASVRGTPAQPKRTQTETIENAMRLALSGENVDDILGKFNADETNLFYSLLEILRNEGGANIDDLWKIDYTSAPPTMEEFVTDEYWLGGILRHVDGERTGLYPVWRETLIRDFDLDSRINNLVITGSLGTGKCVSPGTRFLRYDLTQVKVEDIKVGDVLVDDNSTPQTVIETHSGEDEMYKIVPTKGEPFTCNGEHILVIVDTNTGETDEVSVINYITRCKLCSWYGETQKLYHAPVNFEYRHVNLDPYWLGLWLGDGSSHTAGLTIAHRDVEILEYHKQYCKEVFVDTFIQESSRKENCDQWAVTGDNGHPNFLLKKLQAYGLGGPVHKTCRKFIPKDYLLNDRQTRLELLAGLIDSDGSLVTGSFSISTKWESLADDYCTLARSLGYLVTRKLQKKKIKSRGFVGYYHLVTISGNLDEVPCRIPHKKANPRRQIKNHLRTGFKVIPQGVGKFHGFMVTGSGRVLMHDFLVGHNSYVGVTILLYRIVLARLLRDPQNFFTIGKGSPIYYIILSITKSVVTETAFGDALNFMGESPFFKEECRFNPDNKYSNYRVPLGKGLFLTAGSKGQHAIGRNAMGIMLDEGNFRLEANPDTSAYELYNEVRTRIKNRFQNLSTFLPAISILASSAADESSFTETVIADIKAVNDPNTQHVYRYAVYNVKPDRKYTGICFRVAYGIKNIDPVILAGFCNRQGERIEGGYDHKGQKVAEIGPWEAPPKGAMTEIVPIELLEEYRRNCKMALRNLSGISTGGTNRFFSNMRDIEISIEKGESTGVKNPVLNNLSTIPLSQEDNLELYDFLDHKLFVTKRASSFIPLRHPEAPRYAHLDLATQTLAGLAICHPVGVTKVEGVWDAENGRAFDQYRVCVEYDFILTIGAGRAKPISFEKIQNFFIWLRNYCGFQFAQVSADTFQSVGPLQALERVGFKTDFISLVRTKVPYMTLRSAYEDGRVLMYRQEHFMREAEALLDLNKEIDHPPGGCFTGETKVRLLDGTNPEIKDLVGRENFWVYSNDGNGNVRPGLAKNCRVTKTVTELMEIELDNGEKFRCTPEHPLMMRTGDYERASNLVVGSSLMPLYKIKSVTFIVTDGTPVYDLEVEKYSNFALHAGVFVHNSKDTADAVAGSHYALQMDTEEQGGLKSYEPNIYGDNAMEAIQMAEDVPIKFTVPSAVKQPINVFDA